jgi:hypothetical protein
MKRLQWFPGEMYNNMYGEVQVHSYYLATKPVRPKGKEDQSYLQMTVATRAKAYRNSRLLVQLEFDRTARKVTYYARDNVQNVFHGPYTSPMGDQSEKELTEKLKDLAINKILSPMEILSLSLSQVNPADIQLELPWYFEKLGGDTGVYRKGTMFKDLHISVTIKEDETGKKLIVFFFVLRDGHVINTGPTKQVFDTEKEALKFCENWITAQYETPMEIFTRSLTRTNPFKLNFHYPSQMSWFGDVAEHGTHEIRVQIDPFWVDSMTKYAKLIEVHVSDVSTGKLLAKIQFNKTFKTREEALDHISAWYAEQFLSPMELLASGLDDMKYVKSNPHSNTHSNPRRKYADVKGRSIPARYLKGLPKGLQEKRIRELGKSRDAYKRGDYSELPTDKAARKLGLVKQSAYSIVAEKRGIEWRGDSKEMARRVLKHYGVSASSDQLDKMTEGIQRAYNKGLAAWKSGGHRPGATATNWAVARVASLVVGGKAAFTADKKEFSWFPASLQKKIRAKQKAVLNELEKQGRKEDVAFLSKASRKM